MSPAVSLRWMPAARYLSANRAVTAILGYEPEALIGQNIQLILANTAQQSRSELVKSVQRMSGNEIEGLHQDGSVFPMYIAVSRLKIDQQMLYIGIVQDITARKQLEAEHLEKERLQIALEKERELRQLKDRFISIMSHELKTPLASIRLASDFLKKYSDRSTREEKADAISAIETQVAYLSEIVDDVTTISKTELLGEALNLEVYDLETYVRDILEELEWTYRDTHRLIFSGTERRVEAQIDRKLLRRALINVLSNAVKYSPEGGDVHVDLSVDQTMATVQIRDSGIGIPPEDLPHLFDPFHRGENVGKLPGTGLGLAIARQAIELHSGTISVESQLGVGTTITLRLPLHQPKK